MSEGLPIKKWEELKCNSMKGFTAVTKLVPVIFEFRLFVWLTLGFILFTVIGTVSHESGHYIVARCFGYQAKIHYGSTSVDWYSPQEREFLTTVTQKYRTQIQLHKPFPEKDQLDKICNRLENQAILVTIGGPLETILTGTIGLILLLILRKRYFSSERLSFWQWFIVFITLFWLRQAANFAVGVGTYIIRGSISHRGDEFNLDRYFHLPIGTLWVVTAIFATAILLIVIFKFVPIKQRLTFMAAGIAGGVTGYLFWLVLFGKMIMP